MIGRISGTVMLCIPEASLVPTESDARAQQSLGRGRELSWSEENRLFNEMINRSKRVE